MDNAIGGEIGLVIRIERIIEPIRKHDSKLREPPRKGHDKREVAALSGAFPGQSPTDTWRIDIHLRASR
jgi:hypothetical protein